jgi:hypothetical protein
MVERRKVVGAIGGYVFWLYQAHTRQVSDFRAQESFDISVPVQHADNLDSVLRWAVENQVFSEALHSANANTRVGGIFRLAGNSNSRVPCEEGKRLFRRIEESMGDFQARVTL